MKLDRRITNGLAWAGVLLVVGVPTADLLSAQFSGNKAASEQIAVVTPAAPTPAPAGQRPNEAKPVETAAAAPKPATAQGGSAVDSFLNSGKPLPSYITGGGPATPTPVQTATAPKPASTPTPVVTTPAPAQTATTQPVRTPIVTDPVQTAALPAKVAPIPMPLSMRPDPIRVPVATTAPADIVLPPGLVNNNPRPSGMVDSADLEDWESGPLSEFLAQREGRGGSSATVTSDYDPNGFYFDQGPNAGRDRVVGREVAPFPFFVD